MTPTANTKVHGSGSLRGHNALGKRPARRSSIYCTKSGCLYLLCWCLSLLLLCRLPTSCHAVQTCNSDDDCLTHFGIEGSMCVESTCTNPFHSNGGCLSSMLGDDWKLKHSNNNGQGIIEVPRRICGSEDPPDAVANGYCRMSALDEYYTEVRILVLGWESVNFQAWILQILLSEVLQVPVSIETGISEKSVDFYGVHYAMDYPAYNATYSELNTSSRLLDCRNIQNDIEKPDEYVSCAHVVPEVWSAESLVDSKAVGTGPFRDLGMLSSQSWYVPKFTALRDPSLTTIYGLGGERNREKLARTFKRPTTWKDYCDLVSADGCATDDGVAARPPEEDEFGFMFSEGSYTGHFRYTEANNCMTPEMANANSTIGNGTIISETIATASNSNLTCTGHFADYPCGWNSIASVQLYHNDIALQSDGPIDVRGGYSYGQLKGIWRAANATKEDVMIMWWTPEVLFEEFMGTDAEFVPVKLPTATQECYEALPARGSMCDPNFVVSESDPKGSCDYTAEMIKKFISDGLFEATFASDIPEALQSPAYTTIDNFRMTTLQLNQIFQLMLERGSDYNFDARYATCEWFVENLDQMLSFVPESHPRAVREVDASKDPLFIGALVVACICTLFVIFSSVIIGMKRNTKIVFYAQIEALFVLLFGLLVLGVGTILMVVPHTDQTCVSISWLINLGYAIHFAPLVAKIFAIQNLLSSEGKQMQRLRLGKIQLYRAVGLLTTAVVVFMIWWTMEDPPEKLYAYEVSRQKTGDDEFIILSSNYCGSDSDIWQAASLAWQGVLLLPTAVIAFVSCRNKKDINETRALSMIVYSHSFFLIFRATLYVLEDGLESAELMAYRSLLISGEIISVLAIYFFPKMIESEEMDDSDEMLPDLFLNSSILVADVMGFAAWSSAREPQQVFKLLETLFEKFDTIANKHGVFKVETVRDCYVAATGIPVPQAKHAEVLAKFAIDIMVKMDRLSRKLELMFGPDTGDLTLRIGIHSGPVTGGYLRGKGARFQLFGDTMTTACVIQTTGMSNRIHLSQHTAKLLIDNGRKRWVTKREETIYTREKGELETYWLTRGVKDLGGFDDNASSAAYSDFMSMVSELDNDDYDLLADSRSRWVEWNVEVLSGVLKQILAQRAHRNIVDTIVDESVKSVKNVTRGMSIRAVPNGSFARALSMPLEEVAEIIQLPAFDKKAVMRQQHNNDKKDLDPEVMSELKEYVTMVAGMYKENPFHNFAHASYVVMAVSKYMNRIMSASEIDLGNDGDRQRSSTHAALHDHTYGITSDPLTRFACVFSALIHDVDHPGVPNPRLIEENERLARLYKKRSVAEQNSFDLAWELLMDDSFSRLRNAICSDEAEFKRFRQIVVNSVMATDLGDKESKELRNGRWSKAFAGNGQVQEECLSNSTNRKATIVIEHLIQAADVAHTCQHWNLYRKWNERLFQECYKAHRDGRAEQNPADGWYKGEMGFYDFYIIPLAKKLRDCGVFGQTSDENLNYAYSNRAQWEREGQSIVKEMLALAEEEYNAEYMEESCNNMSPDSEFYSSEFHDEVVMVKLLDDVSEVEDEKIVVKLETIDDDCKMEDEPIDEQVKVRFKDK